MVETITWVRVSEQKPPIRNQVLIIVDGFAHVGWFGKDDKWRIGSSYCDDPTYWSLLPVGPA